MRKETGKKLLKNFTAIIATLVLLLSIVGVSVEGGHSSRADETVEGWSEDVMLSVEDIYWAHDPDIAVYENNVHVVYKEQGISYRRSIDAGRNWDEAKWICDAEAWCPDNPSIAINNTNLYVVWEDLRGETKEIYYTRSTNNGETWSEDTALTSDDGYMSGQPQIAVNNSNIHVVWKDERDTGSWGLGEIYYKRSTNNGGDWDDGQGNINTDRRLTNNTEDSDLPRIAVNGDTIHVFWSDKRSGNYEAWYMRSENNGETWNTPTNITPVDGIDTWVTDVAIDENKIYVVGEDHKWDGNKYLYRIWYINSNDNGGNWSQPTLLSDHFTTKDYCTWGQITINKTEIYIVWYDNRSTPDTNPDDSFLPGEAYLKYSTNYGANWSDALIITYSNGTTCPRGIVYENNMIHLIMTSERTGNVEVFYKRSPDFNHPPEIISWYPLENLTITEDQNITFTINTSDLNNDTLGYQWYLNNESVGGNQSSYSFVANSTCSGIFEIRVVVSDNVSSSVNHSWTLTVINVGELYDSIADLQDQISQLNLIVSELNETINSLTQNLTVIWDELNQSVQSYSDLQNQTISLLNTLSEIWDAFNLSKMNETELQGFISNLTEDLTTAQEQISVLWGLLNQSKHNETSLLSQISELENENEKLRNELNETKNKTPWVGVAETFIIILLVCIMVIFYRKKKHRGGRLV